MVSIVVLTHNRKRLLAKCLASLFAQDWPRNDYEIIVADDGSTDGTGELVRELDAPEPHLRYVWQHRRGVAGARNLGLRHARGAWISFVADDYELAPDYIRTAMRLFAEQPDRLVVRFKVVAAGADFGSRVSGLYYELGAIRRLGVWGVERRPWKIARALARYQVRPTEDHGLEPAGAACFRREVFDRAGWFDEGLERGEDTEFGVRLRGHGIPIYYYPRHEIRHHLEPYPWPALAKAYRSGRYRFRYYLYNRHGGAASDGKPPGWLALGLEKAAAAAGLAVYCYRHRILTRVALLSPLLASIEAANKLGFVWEALRSSRRPPLRAAEPGPYTERD